MAMTRKASASRRYSVPNLASQMCVAFDKRAWKTGSGSPGDELMRVNTSDVAVC